MWEKILFGIYLTGISICDIKSRSVSRRSLVLAGTGVLVNVIYKIWNGDMLLLGVLMSMIPGIILMLLARISSKIGYADGIVVIFLGAFLGGRYGLAIMGLGLFLMSVVSVILLLMKKVSGRTELPYFPFLTMAYWICFGGWKLL